MRREGRKAVLLRTCAGLIISVIDLFISNGSENYIIGLVEHVGRRYGEEKDRKRTVISINLTFRTHAVQHVQVFDKYRCLVWTLMCAYI